jgi:hypothetical protein
MSVRQLSVFVENKTGHLAAALSILAEGGVNVLSFTIADTTDYGILRLIVDRVDRAKELLAAGDYAVVEHRLVRALVPNEPGVLATILRVVAESGIDIEYLYLGAGDTLLFKAEEYEQLEQLLESYGFQVFKSDGPPE